MNRGYLGISECSDASPTTFFHPFPLIIIFFIRPFGAYITHSSCCLTLSVAVYLTIRKFSLDVGGFTCAISKSVEGFVKRGTDGWFDVFLIRTKWDRVVKASKGNCWK